MLPRRLSLITVMLLLPCAHNALADNDQRPRAVANVAAKGLDQLVYKGLVGNALDGIAMDPTKRVNLQRTNAILSNTLSGHSLTALAGLSKPVLLIGGLFWGVWAASNIKAEDDGAPAMPESSSSREDPAVPKPLLALLQDASAPGLTLASMPAASDSKQASEARLRVQAPVVKVWLPQRSQSQ